MSCSAPADFARYQTALLVRVTPASENAKPVAAPPSPPLKPRLIALIWLLICAFVTAPAAPSVTTCQYTDTVTEKLLGARPLAAAGEVVNDLAAVLVADETAAVDGHAPCRPAASFGAWASGGGARSLAESTPKRAVRYSRRETVAGPASEMDRAGRRQQRQPATCDGHHAILQNGGGRARRQLQCVG